MATAIEQIISGLRAYGKAADLIKKNSMGKYFVIPIIINIALMCALVWGGWGLGDWVSSLWDTSQGGWLSWLGAAVQWVMPIIFFVLFIFIGGTVCNILMSPIYTTISEKADTAITGREFSTTAGQTASDIWRTVVISLKNTVKQLLVTLVCLLLNLVPVIGQVLSVAMVFIVNAYYFGYGFMDYSNERWRRNAKETNEVVYRYKYLAIAIGAVYALPMYIVCGTFFAAFTGGVSTVAATIAQMELEGKDNARTALTEQN